MIHWKKFALLLAGVLVVSTGSSLLTWFYLSRGASGHQSWDKLLNLTPGQSEKFSKMESDLNFTLKDMDLDDAQNKIALCSYLHEGQQPEAELRSTTRKMAETYQKKQEKIALTLASISGILTPEQRKTFLSRLMREVCVSCRRSTGVDTCLCGMCSI